MLDVVVTEVLLQFSLHKSLFNTAPFVSSSMRSPHQNLADYPAEQEVCAPYPSASFPASSDTNSNQALHAGISSSVWQNTCCPTSQSDAMHLQHHRSQSATSLLSKYLFPLLHVVLRGAVAAVTTQTPCGVVDHNSHGNPHSSPNAPCTTARLSATEYYLDTENAVAMSGLVWVTAVLQTRRAVGEGSSVDGTPSEPARCAAHEEILYVAMTRLIGMSFSGAVYTTSCSRKNVCAKKNNIDVLRFRPPLARTLGVAIVSKITYTHHAALRPQASSTCGKAITAPQAFIHFFLQKYLAPCAPATRTTDQQLPREETGLARKKKCLPLLLIALRYAGAHGSAADADALRHAHRRRALALHKIVTLLSAYSKIGSNRDFVVLKVVGVNVGKLSQWRKMQAYTAQYGDAEGEREGERDEDEFEEDYFHPSRYDILLIRGFVPNQHQHKDRLPIGSHHTGKKNRKRNRRDENAEKSSHMKSANDNEHPAQQEKSIHHVAANSDPITPSEYFRQWVLVTLSDLRSFGVVSNLATNTAAPAADRSCEQHNISSLYYVVACDYIPPHYIDFCYTA